MKKLSIILVALLSAALLTSALAAAKSKDAVSAKKTAERECEAQKRADLGAFWATYGNQAMRRCVASEKAEAKAEIHNATRECREERGSGKSGNNGLGRCVSSRVRLDRHEDVAAFKNAAQECRAERGDTEESQAAFELKYGTNETLSDYRPGHGNAFGKCVSSKVKPGAGS